jgi:hypothetical protein
MTHVEKYTGIRKLEIQVKIHHTCWDGKNVVARQHYSGRKYLHDVL